MADTASQLTDHELWLEGTDQSNRPYIPWRGMLYWTGSAWARWEGTITATNLDIRDLTHATDSVLVYGRDTSAADQVIPVNDGKHAIAKAVDVQGGFYYSGVWNASDGTVTPIRTDEEGRTILSADSEIIQVKTDQTTHGTTDLVAADVTKLAGTAIDVNSGNKSNGTQRVVLATDQPALSTAMPTTAVGTIADDSTTPGAPVMIGGTAKETDGTDPGSVSAEDDVTRLITDRNRRLLVNTFHPNHWTAYHDETAAQTNHQIKAAPGANLALYITDVVVSNGATAGTIKLVEDEGGTPAQISQTIYMAVNGGAVIHWQTPKRLTVNKSLGFTSVTVTTHSVEVHGYTAP